MKIVKRIVAVLALLIGLLVIIGFLSPKEQHVERSISINASPEIVFNQINDLKNWENWSPWIKLDPAMIRTYSDPSAGAGAFNTWSSENENVGKGKLTITESHPSTLINTYLEFEGMEPANGYFKFDAEGAGTKVTWAIDANMGSNPIHRLMGLMMDMMMDGPFNEGLAGIKNVSENIPVQEQTILDADTNSTIAE